MIKRIVILVFLVYFMSFVSAVSSINLNCPEFMNVNEEFSCSLKVSELEGVWDVKFELVENGKTIAKIWSEEKNSWQSAYYYLKEFIVSGEEKDIKLLVEKQGNFNGILKLRQGSKTKSSSFILEVKGVSEENTEEDNVEDTTEKADEEIIEETTDSDETSENDEEQDIESIQSNYQEKRTIYLNNPEETPVVSEAISPTGEVIYESKNSKILKYLPYALSLFLIFIILILFREKL